MPVEIPGYYYDRERGKYFKIEKAQTAPSSAAWSSDAVKRRKTEAAAERVARERRDKLRHHIKRHGLRDDIVLSGFLGREVGSRVSHGDDVGVAAWADGLVGKGKVSFGPDVSDGRHLPCLWVGSEGEGSNLGVAYTTLDEESAVGSHIPLDGDGRVVFEPDAPPATGRAPARYLEPVRCPQMSSIKYHAPSHKMLLTSREPDHSCGLFLFSPPLAESHGERARWLLGESNFYQRLSMRHRHRGEWHVNSSTPAPSPSSDLVCVMGTNAGVVRVASNDTMSLLAPPLQHPKGRDARGGSRPAAPREIFDVDFGADPNVVFAGGRASKVWMADMRAPDSAWSSFQHASSVAKLRCVGENKVVACGLQSSMALYDVRFLQAGAGRGGAAGRHRPLVAFQGHRNEEHLHIGFDVWSGMGGVVAAAQDDGTVGLFSLASGRRLRCLAVSRGTSARGGGSERGVGRGKGRPIKALMFADMPGERTPSLWVGEGLSIAKYTFGKGDLDEEW